MSSHGKAVPRFVSERPTGGQRRDSSFAPATSGRFVSPTGPDRPAGKSHRTKEVCFLASAPTWERAQELKIELSSNGPTTIVIYRRSRVRNRLRLWQVDPAAGAPPLRARTAVAFDLFRVPDKVLGKKKRLATAVARVLDGYGQAPPPSNVDPR